MSAVSWETRQCTGTFVLSRLYLAVNELVLSENQLTASLPSALGTEAENPPALNGNGDEHVLTLLRMIDERQTGNISQRS